MRGIDLIASGTTAGAKDAGGNVVWAANHNSLAVEFHPRNPPEAMHVC